MLRLHADHTHMLQPVTISSLQPEPREFLVSKDTMALQRAVTVTANNVATSFVQHSSLNASGTRTSSLNASGKHSSLNASGKRTSSAKTQVLGVKQLSQRLVELTEPADATMGGTAAAVDASIAMATVAHASSTSAAVGGMPAASPQHPAALVKVPSHVVLRVQSLRQRQSLRSSGRCDSTIPVSGDMDAAVAACTERFADELVKVAAVTKRHVPLKVLFLDHWRQGVLFMGLWALPGE
jgi:hypothetical protein